MTNLIDELGSLRGEMNMWDGVFTAGTTFLLFNMAVHYFKNSPVPPVFYAYLANFLVATSAQLSMAYALLLFVKASVTNLGFFYTYDNITTLGDYFGLYEMVVLLMYVGWSGVWSVAGNYLALIMWLNIDAYEDPKTHVNKLTTIQGYKYLLVGIIFSLGGWISALGLGESLGNLLNWFDFYTTDAITKDSTGSSLYIDLTLHLIESFFYMVVLTIVTGGGYSVGIFMMGQELNFSDGVASLSN